MGGDGLTPLHCGLRSKIHVLITWTPPCAPVWCAPADYAAAERTTGRPVSTQCRIVHAEYIAIHGIKTK